MIDDPEELQARIAYVQTVRGIAQLPRQFGFVCCLIGVILLTYATYKIPGGPMSPFGLTGLGVIAVGWALLVYSMIARTRYVRAHPFSPKA